jgi:hypothetical protein
MNDGKDGHDVPRGQVPVDQAIGLDDDLAVWHIRQLGDPATTAGKSFEISGCRFDTGDHPFRSLPGIPCDECKDLLDVALSRVKPNYFSHSSVFRTKSSWEI